MYVCMYVMYVCMYVCMYIYIYEYPTKRLMTKVVGCGLGMFKFVLNLHNR